MSRLKRSQTSLLCTALIATVLSVCVPLDVIPVLYVMLYVAFVFAPQTAVIFLQLIAVKRRLEEYKSAEEETAPRKYPRERKRLVFPTIGIEALHTIAKLKSMGIDPSRAGPCAAAA